MTKIYLIGDVKMDIKIEKNKDLLVKYLTNKDKKALLSLKEIEREIIIAINGLEDEVLRMPKEVCRVLNIETTNPYTKVYSAHNRLVRKVKSIHKTLGC